jgi:hypothetical protein
LKIYCRVLMKKNRTTKGQDNFDNEDGNSDACPTKTSHVDPRRSIIKKKDLAVMQDLRYFSNPNIIRLVGEVIVFKP